MNVGVQRKQLKTKTLPEKKFEKLECPDCKSTDVEFSFDQDEYFCKKCGLVLEW